MKKNITEFFGKAASLLLCCGLAVTMLTSCGERTLEMNTSGVTTSKVTHQGVIEYYGGYYITDKFGINYKASIDNKDMVIVAHTSKENGEVQKNFAIDDKYIYFISAYKDSSKILYRGTMDGKKRTKIYVRDEINIIACYKNKIYFTDERNMIICIDAATKEKLEINAAVGKDFVQYNNCIFFTDSNKKLAVYNCDDNAVIPVTENNAAGYSATDNGTAIAENISGDKKSTKYQFSFFTYSKAEIKSMAAVETAAKYTVFSNSLAFANEKTSLKTCGLNNGEEKEYSYKKQGKLIYNTGMDNNVYYLNENTCLKFEPTAEAPKELTVDFKKNKIDYNNVIAIVNDTKAITSENGYYEIVNIN